MRKGALAAIATLGLTLAVSANASPMAPNPTTHQGANIVEAAWGCGWGFHPNRWGYCVPNRYGWHRPYWRQYYGGGYYPYWRHRNYYGYY